jgi:fucose permease
MQETLNMNAVNNGYTIVSLVFFISYTIFQVPAVVLIRKLGPRNFLTGITLSWGAVMIVRTCNCCLANTY